jgi:hypothetical protein
MRVNLELQVIPEAGPSSRRDDDCLVPHDGDDVACDVAEAGMDTTDGDQGHEVRWEALRLECNREL